jgi:uncharacterized protein YukE
MDRSWEDYVNAVCVKGRPGKLGDLALDWETLFRNAASVTQSLRDGIRELKEHWKGPAADDYFDKLEGFAKQIEKIESDNKGIIQLLQQAKEALAVAQTTMPVPDYMLDEVQGRQAQLDAANAAGARDIVGGMTLGLGAPVLFLPDSFMKPLADSFIGDWGREAFGHVTALFDDWDDSMTNQARDIFNTADSAYAQGAATTPQPVMALPSKGIDLNPLNLNPGGPGPGVTPFGGPHPGAGNVDLNKGPGSSGLGANFDPLGDPSGDSSSLPGTGLSGAGGGGFTGAGGGGFGGLGGAGGALADGAGLSSAIAGPSGAGAVGIGRAVSPPAGMMAPMGAMGGAGAAGRAARGTGARTGMVGGPHGGGPAGNGDDRTSWLTEDEDVWGSDDGASPGLLK